DDLPALEASRMRRNDVYPFSEADTFLISADINRLAHRCVRRGVVVAVKRHPSVFAHHSHLKLVRIKGPLRKRDKTLRLKQEPVHWSLSRRLVFADVGDFIQPGACLRSQVVQVPKASTVVKRLTDEAHPVLDPPFEFGIAHRSR